VRARQSQRLVEHYWLCDECAAKWTLIYHHECGIELTPLRARAASAGLGAAQTEAA
jgi:hypothetical protein